MKVTDAVATRKSIRAFEPTAVSNETLRDLLVGSARAPSGGNVQPWITYVVNGASMDRFLKFMDGRPFDQAEYDVYPPKLWEPYRSSRFEVGEDMYALLGIARDDRDARLARMAENYKFFGAPAAVFCFIDRNMGPPQWSDLGMFLQTFMLLAREQGLDTCAQEAWSTFGASVAEFVGAPDDTMLFCGMAVGYRDQQAAVNGLESKRRPLDTWNTFVD